MTNRTTSLLSSVAVAMLAGAAAMTIEFQPASAADECLTKPKEGQPGKHWFYRIDRATKKQCWYLRDDDRASQGASLVTRKLASHRDRTTLSSSAADARAEFQSAPNQVGDETKATPSIPSAPARSSASFPPVAAFPTTTSPEAAPSTMIGVAAPAPVSPAPAADTADVAASDSTVATRWPDSSGTLQTQPAPAPRPSSYTLAAATSDAASAETAAPATAEPAAVAEALPSPLGGFGADDTSRTRLFAFLGAVAVAGFCTSVLFARARARRQVRLQPVAGRIPRWPAEPELDGMQLPSVAHAYPGLVRRESQPRKAQAFIVPRDDARYDEQYEVEDLLARYSGQGRRTS